MKKSNVTIIATLLIAVHILVFGLFVGKSKDGKKRAPAHTESAQPAPAIDSMAHFAIPKLATPALEEAIIPVEIVERPPAPVRETIATPGHRAGYMRSDRSNRRTTKVYPKLTGNPYRGAIVIDARTGKILYENRATTYCYPASVTKLMTMLIVLEQIDAGVIRLTDKIKITNEIAKIGGSQVWLDPRETDFTIDDMLYALMVHSANDAAYALAVHVAGSRDTFVDMMNQKARELGMNATTYHSPHGLPPTDGTQPDISTPYDIAILSLAALRLPNTLHYTSTELKYIRGGATMLATRNALAKRVDGYQGCDGLKTGYHNMGGWSLTATAERNGQRIISVVLGSPDKTTRYAISRKLLDKGFQTLKN